jgi:MSHA biogenesis protein MshL
MTLRQKTKKHLSSLIVMLLIAPLLLSCNTAPPKKGTAMDDIDAAIKEGVDSHQPASEQPPAEITEALMPSVKIDLPQTGEAPQQRFDISVNHAPAREFFLSMVEGTDVNMVVHPDVSGEITLNLKNVTIAEVMEVVRNVYGYEYSKTESGYQVMPITMQTRIFQVSYLNVAREGHSQTRISSGQVTESDRSLSENGTTTTRRTSGDEDQSSGSRVSTESKADFWSELQTSLSAIVGNGDGRNVILSPQTGVVVVRALPAELREVERFLQLIQTSVERQVILEAKILEVILNDGFQSGINWTALGKPGKNKTVLGAQHGGGSIFNGSGVSNTADSNVTLQPETAPFTGIIDTAFGGVFSAALNLDDFTAFIELLETQGNVQVLSSPRVATVNNQKAVIKVGTDEFFVTDISTTTTTGTTTTTNPDVTLTPFFSGIALDVIPQISDKGEIILHIHPSVSEVDEEIKSIGLSSTSNLTVPLAVSTIRESDSIVRASNGQIVVIGGLMQNNTSEDVASTPLLGDIPFVGSLFRHTKQSSRKSELVILLKPIVVGEGTWRQELQQSGRQYQKLRQGFHYGGKQEVFGTEAEGR